MTKITKTFFILCLAIIMCLSNTPLTTLAAENENTTNTISPRWSHLENVDFLFSATSSGGHTEVSYSGYTDSFARADIHVKLQKKFLLVFWTDVDEWSMSSTELIETYYHCFTLNGTGTYKATLTFTVTGADGTVDTYNTEIESKYSN